MHLQDGVGAITDVDPGSHPIAFRVQNGVVQDNDGHATNLFTHIYGLGSGGDGTANTAVWTVTADPVLYESGLNVGTASEILVQVNFRPTHADVFPPATQSLEKTLELTVNYGGPKRDCETCGDQVNSCPAGSGREGLASIYVKRNLGADRFGNFNNYLAFKTSLPNPFLGTPGLLFARTSTNCEVLAKSSGILSQVRAPLILADIVTNTAYKYDIRFYHTNDVSPNKTNDFWVPTTNNAYRFTTVENPDGSSASNRLFVTDTDPINNVTNQSKYTWDGTNAWRLEPPGGIRKETLSRSWSTNTFPERTELRSILDPSNLVYQEQKKLTIFPWGEELTELVVDPNGAKLTNTWDYYTNSALLGNYGQLMNRTEPSGYWESYGYDISFRETNRLTAFLNATNGSSADQCRQNLTLYATNNQTVTNITKILGQEVARSYRIYSLDRVREITCQTPLAGTNAVDNLAKTTLNHPDGSPFAGEAMLVTNWDGTIEFYSYSISGDQKTTMLSIGQPDSSGTNVLEGTRTVTIVGPAGEMISRVSTNVTGGASGIQLSSEIYTYPAGDVFHQSPATTFLDGTSNQVNFGCCNIDHTINREGTPTYFTYDALKRKTSTSFNNITSSNILDAAGHSVKSIRIGNDNSLITQGQIVYDTAGRITELTNAVNARTGTRYSADQLTTTNIFADGSTRIETHFIDGRLQSITGTAVHDVRFDYGVISDGGTYRLYEAKILLDSGGSDTLETVTNYSDMLGRIYKTAYPSVTGPVFATSYFNTRGRLTNQIDPDGVSMIYVFNAKAEQSHTIVDMNQDHVIDFSGGDRIAMVTNDVVSDNGSDVRRTRSYVWPTSADAATLISTAETSVDGSKSWNILWNNGTAVTSSNVTRIDSATGRRVVTSYAPDGSYTVATNQNGKLISVTSRDANGSQIGRTVYGYDAHGRQSTNSDARTGPTTFSFDAADQNTGMTTPDLGSGAQVTTNYLDSLGRVWKVGYPDGTSLTNVFYSTGELELASGTRTYPTGYRRDGQGRLTGMTNWTTFPSAGARVTSWTNDPYRDLVINKVYPDTNATAYTYTPAGRLKTRTWARGVVTTAGLNNAGEISGVTFSDGTPALTIVYDRRGRAVTNIQGSATCTLAFNDRGQLLSESYTGGPLDSISLTNGYDSFLRRTKQVTLLSGTILTTTTNGFDAASRLQSVSDNTNAAIYSYLANSPLISSVGFQQNGSNRLAVTKIFDNLDRLIGLSNAPVTDTLLSFNYAYNSANRRTAVTNEASSRWAYQNDFLGQVISGKKYWSDGTPVAGQQYEYAFDDIGNRKYAASGGDEWGANLRYENYTVNSLNEYTQRTVPGSFDVLGTATNTSTVTVNNRATYRKGEYFRMNYAVDNSTSAVWLNLTNIAALQNGTNADLVATNTGNAFLPQTPEVFGFDPDGNQTNDGRWTIVWDAQNRVTSFVSLANGPIGSKRKLDLSHDYVGRRTQKIVSTNNGASYFGQYTNKFVYDRWNVVAVLDGGNNLLYSFRWGIDASGRRYGAGGVGGLIAMTIHSGSFAGTYFYAYDGNHNVVGLVSAADGTIAAQYEYGPFGQLIRTTGPLAFLNPFRFSTKYQDDETGFVYYGARYLNPSTGRWLSREPLGESASLNVYSFLENNSLNAVDVLGLYNSAGHFYTTYAVARAAGLSDDDAFNLAYWSQYPDQDPSYDATDNFWKLQWDVGHFMHSLSGGDPQELRAYLECLLNSGNFNKEEMGILIHALGDAYAHTYIDINPTMGSPKQLRPNPNFGKLVLYPPGPGHGPAGHIPDYIGQDPAKYGDYVDQLYGFLSTLPNAGAPNPDWIDAIKVAANSLEMPSVYDYVKSDKLNEQEVKVLSSVPGGYGQSAYKYNPDTTRFLPNKDKLNDPDFRRNFIDKVKNGTQGCCLKK